MSKELGSIIAPMHLEMNKVIQTGHIVYLEEDLNKISLLQFSAGVKNGKMLQIRIGDSYHAESRVLLNRLQVEQLRDMLNVYLAE